MVCKKPNLIGCGEFINKPIAPSHGSGIQLPTAYAQPASGVLKPRNCFATGAPTCGAGGFGHQKTRPAPGLPAAQRGVETNKQQDPEPGGEGQAGDHRVILHAGELSSTNWSRAPTSEFGGNQL